MNRKVQKLYRQNQIFFQNYSQNTVIQRPQICSGNYYENCMIKILKRKITFKFSYTCINATLILSF